jgi:hypothetical protein
MAARPMPHAVTKRLFALSDVIRYFGFDPKASAA